MDLPVHSTNGKGRPFVPIRNSGSIRNLVFSACLNSTFVGDWLALKACICELFLHFSLIPTCHFARYLRQFFARYLHHLTGQITLKVESPLADF